MEAAWFPASGTLVVMNNGGTEADAEVRCPAGTRTFSGRGRMEFVRMDSGLTRTGFMVKSAQESRKNNWK